MLNISANDSDVNEWRVAERQSNLKYLHSNPNPDKSDHHEPTGLEGLMERTGGICPHPTMKSH